MTTDLKAGLARRTISPPKGIYLIGYGDRIWGNRGVHDDLTATALALDDGTTRVVIIACDLLAINEITLARVKKGLKENLLLCCSHTHSGPIVYADKRSSRKNKKYVDFLVHQLIEVAREALENPQPADFVWGSGSAEIAVNRRERKPDGRIEIGVNLDGIVDRSIGIIHVRRKGKPLANLVNFSCHNVVLGPKNLLVSADWTGVMRCHVEKSTGVPCLFIQGATADLNPNHEWGEDDFKGIEHLGKRVADGVLAGMADLTPFEGTPLKFQESEIWLPLEIKASTPEPPPTYKKRLAVFTGAPQFLVDPLLNWRYPWKTEVNNRNGYWSIPMVITILKAGQLAWVGLGAEVFNEIGMIIKGKTASPYTFFSSVSNGCIGYLPTESEYLLGGYEVDLAPLFYRLPGRLQSDVAVKVVSETARFL
jgi:hypothetical protein